MAELNGQALNSLDFDKLIDEDSMSKVAAYMYSGGDFDDEVSEESEVPQESSSLVGEFLRSKMLSNGNKDV